MRTIRPIRPIRAIGQAVLRRTPPMWQLRLWQWFARQKGKQRSARLAMSNQEPGLQPTGNPTRTDGEAKPSDTPIHIDKRV
jgi:hypothetical protein